MAATESFLPLGFPVSGSPASASGAVSLMARSPCRHHSDRSPQQFVVPDRRNVVDVDVLITLRDFNRRHEIDDAHRVLLVIAVGVLIVERRLALRSRTECADVMVLAAPGHDDGSFACGRLSLA